MSYRELEKIFGKKILQEYYSCKNRGELLKKEDYNFFKQYN